MNVRNSTITIVRAILPLLVFLMSARALPAQDPLEETTPPPDTITRSCTAMIDGAVRITNQPLPGVQVSAKLREQPSSVPHTTTTDSTGSYVFPALTPGEYQVTLSASDLLPLSYLQMDIPRAVRLTPNDTVTVNFDGTLRRDGRITGQVTVDGVPPARAIVTAIRHPASDLRLSRRAYTMITDTTGHYSLDDLPPGQYSLTLSPVDTALVNADPATVVSVGPGSLVQVDFNDTSEARQSWYWLLGIVIPLLFGITAVRVILVDIETRRDNLRKGQERARNWWEKWSDVQKRHRIIAERAEGGSGRRMERLRAHLWLLMHDRRKRYRSHRVEGKGDRQERTQRGRDADLAQLKKASGCANTVWKRRRKKLRAAFGQVWDGLSHLADEGNSRSWTTGLIVPGLAFWVSYWLMADNGRWLDDLLGRDGLRPLAALGVVAVVYVVGLGVAAGRWGAYAWSCSILIYLGINTIELSGFEAAATIGGLYDSQTIDVLFVCVVTMLGLREMRSVRSREKCGCGRAAECRHFEEVRGVLERIVPKAKDPGRREARWRRLLAVSYVALAVHAVWPSVAIVRTGAELEGVLVAITSTVICGLLVPLLALCRPESGDRGRECGKEPRRGGAEGGGDGAMAAARIVLVVSLFVGVGGVGAKLEGQTAGDGASELAETTEGLQRWYTVWVENGEALVLLPGSDHWGFVVGRFGTGDVKEIEFTATSGVRYKVGGAGAAAARDLDICVYDAGGGQIRCDDAADTIPLVSFVAESTGTYKAQLIATDVERPTTAGMILVRVGVP